MLSILEPECRAFQYKPIQTRIFDKYRYEETSNTKKDVRKIRKIYNAKHFSYEMIRKATFDSWSYDFINKDELAKAGFYCLKHKDHVQCFYCRGVVGFWEEGDRPLREHEKHFPNCPFVQGSLTSNVPLVNEDEESNLNVVLNNCLMRTLEGSQVPTPCSSVQKDSCRSSYNALAYPSFQSREKRLLTLTNWPKEDVPSPEDVAGAGFFYAGIADFVLCYSCGGGLFNWTKYDDPRKDHLKYYSHCPLFSKETCQTKDLTSSKLNTLKPGEEEMLLQYPISQKLVEMGLSRCSITNALKDHLEKYSFLPSSLMDCIAVVVDWDDKNKGNVNLEETDNMTEDLCDSGKGSSISMEATSKSENNSDRSQGQTLLLELAREKLKYICKDCKTNQIEAITLPCQHFHYCESCLSKTDFCPTCQTKILKIILPSLS